MPGSFPWAPLAEHLHRNDVVCRGILGETVCAQGSGPYDEEDFDHLLETCGIQVFAIDDSGPRVLVLGREDWEPEDLDAAIEARRGRDLRVYSQEMVIASLALGEDLFDICTYDELIHFGGDHPALEYLSEFSFDWPSCEITAVNELVVHLDSEDWPERGVLGKMGYRVGKTGLSEAERQEILNEVLNVELVAGSGDMVEDYINEWGSPRSARRLEKMANAIAAFANIAQRRTHADYSQAISAWRADLEWLKTEYYEPRMGFRWPHTQVLD